MSSIIIAAITIVILIIFKFYSGSNKSVKNTNRPPRDSKPSIEKSNDKLIIVKNVEHSQITIALTDFCNTYNQNDFAAQPRLHQLPNNTFAITFPFDVDFATFCFAVNYLKYPIDIKWNTNVYAWATVKMSDGFTTENSDNKLSMFFLETGDKEYDNVFLTTSNGIGYKIPFTNLKPKVLSLPLENFKNSTVNIQELTDLKFEDFE